MSIASGQSIIVGGTDLRLDRLGCNSAFWPLTNTTEMIADGNCGFRAVAHTIHGRESSWPEARQRLLDHLNCDPAGYLRDVAIALTGAGI